MTQPRQDDPQFKLRLPRHLLMSIAEAANANNRSTNAEIVTRLEADGETLRDRMAMAALPIVAGHSWDHLGTTEAKLSAWATTAYAVADAMLAARQMGARP